MDGAAVFVQEDEGLTLTKLRHEELLDNLFLVEVLVVKFLSFLNFLLHHIVLVVVGELLIAAKPWSGMELLKLQVLVLVLVLVQDGNLRGHRVHLRQEVHADTFGSSYSVKFLKHFCFLMYYNLD